MEKPNPLRDIGLRHGLLTLSKDRREWSMGLRWYLFFISFSTFQISLKLELIRFWVSHLLSEKLLWNELVMTELLKELCLLKR